MTHQFINTTVAIQDTATTIFTGRRQVASITVNCTTARSIVFSDIDDVEIFEIRTVANQTVNWYPCEPVDFENGLRVLVGTAATANASVMHSRAL